MSIEEVANIISKIADGFENACIMCMDDNKEVILQSIREQLWSGMSGTGEFLYPTYLDDPFFEQPGHWYKQSRAYMAWKRAITPPTSGYMLLLPPRPDEVPNLFITGKFHQEINIRREGDELVTDPGIGNGPDIVDKYGEDILSMTPLAVGYFNENYLEPAINEFFKNCGYQ